MAEFGEDDPQPYIPGRRFVPPYLPQGQEERGVIAPAPRSGDYPQTDEYGHIPEHGPALTPLSPPPNERDAGGGIFNTLLGIGTAHADPLPPAPPGFEPITRPGTPPPPPGFQPITPPKAAQPPQTQPGEPPSFLSRMWSDLTGKAQEAGKQYLGYSKGVAEGIAEPFIGMAQGASHLGMQPPPAGMPEFGQFTPDLLGEPVKPQDIDKAVQTHEQAFKKETAETPLAAAWGRMVGETISPPNLMLGGGLAGAGRGVTRNLVGGALTGAAAGAMQPVTSGPYGAEKATQIGTGAALGGTLGTLAGAISGKDPAAVDRFIQSQYRQGVRPTIVGRPGAVNRADEQVLTGVKDIVANKNALTFEDGTITGQVPQTLEQFSSAITQTEQKLFRQYDAQMRAASAKGAKVDLEPAAKELDQLAADPALKLSNPDLVRYATRKAKQLRGTGAITPEVAQRTIQNFNAMAKLQGLYNRRGPQQAVQEVVDQAGVDAVIAHQMRNELDNAITKLEGPGYQDFKNRYGALSALQKNVVRAAQRDAAKKGNAGLIGTFMDAETAMQLAHAAATLNPAPAVKAGLYQSVKGLVGYYRSPNRAIKRLFDAAEQRAPSATSRVLRAVTPGAAGEGADLTNQQPPMSYSIRQ